MTEFEQMFPTGEPNDAYAQYFSGQSYLAPLASGDANVNNVTFEPGCRNNWHIHHGAQQVLICTAGTGWYQAEGEPAQELQPGTVVTVPAEVKHWHGAAAGSWFSHLAVMVPKDDASNEWLEPVSDEEYDAL
ncbi:cupin domain-containing protein [Propioniciclava soli]|uniref:Cupin domain-containing protein n=1 Tax=Propioniciclava soli TaxID=2775081 RepID=A0ABZ3CAY5_9ACTN|nr:cupin domain-containing protein [Propioniciclava soli]